MLKAKSRWHVEREPNEGIAQLAEQLSLSPFVATLLWNRGLTTVEAAKQFLSVQTMNFHDPFLLTGMDVAVERIKQAIADEQRIMIFGDYDADGVSSTTVLMTALRRIGADVQYYIPNRFTEGYGPNEAAFRAFAEDGIGLVITVDTGISAVHEASVLAELGVDYIITDHHEPGPVLPEALAIIHPKLPGSTYPFRELAGVGVAFKLAHALLGEAPIDLLEIAAIGTVADLVALVDENRQIVYHGLKQMKKTTRPGLLALMKVSNIQPSDVTEESIGFAFGPRINAAGRLDHAEPALLLLLAEDDDEAMILAEEVDALNKERQKLVQKMAEEAFAEVETLYPPEKNGVLVIARENWNAGVVGIVASKIVEKFYRPTIVLSIDREKGIAKGSARSIEGFDLFHHLSELRAILPHFGGHPMAAGMTLAIDDVDTLRTRMNEMAFAVLTEEDFTPITKVESVFTVDQLTIQSCEQMQLLAPFGMGNPKPRIMIENVRLAGAKKIGGDQTHLKAVLVQGGHSIDMIAFNQAASLDHISETADVSVIGELSINEWNGYRKAQFMVADMRVTTWQLFDWRGQKDWYRQLTARDDVTFVVFEKQTITDYHLPMEKTHWYGEKIERHTPYIAIVDFPSSEEELRTVIEQFSPERVYFLFLQAKSDFFSTLPTRDHFKWYYGFLAKRNPFDLKRYAGELAAHKGWSKDTIHFMSQVFFELGFVTMNNGMLSLNVATEKRDLTTSPAYQAKLARAQLEQRYLYASTEQLHEQVAQWLQPLAIQG